MAYSGIPKCETITLIKTYNELDDPTKNGPQANYICISHHITRNDLDTLQDDLQEVAISTTEVDRRSAKINTTQQRNTKLIA